MVDDRWGLLYDCRLDDFSLCWGESREPGRSGPRTLVGGTRSIEVGKHGLTTTSPLGSRCRSVLAGGLFVAALLWWTDPVSAGCGDYVIFRQIGGASLSHAVLPLAPAEILLPDQGPCHGPLCRGNKPVDPVPTPPAPEQIDQRPLALVTVTGQTENPFLAGSGWPRLDESPLDGFRPSLLRPPCA